MNKDLIAHLPYKPKYEPKNSPVVGEVHSLFEHSRTVAQRCGVFMQRIFGARGRSAGRLIGLLHDAGKGNPEWQVGIREIQQGMNRSLPPHSIYGASFLHARFPELHVLIHAIQCHHSGLHDEQTEMKDALRTAPDDSFVTEVLGELMGEVIRYAQDASGIALRRNIDNGFHKMFASKMVLSCLVDADRLDTERFMHLKKAVTRDSLKRGRFFKATLNRLTTFRSKNIIPCPNVQIQETRDLLLDAARTAARGRPGVYLMTGPTGSGKTLSSLEFALRHAVMNQCFDRVIFVEPFLSIIEQNADVIRRAIEPTYDEFQRANPDRKSELRETFDTQRSLLLEHHSFHDENERTSERHRSDYKDYRSLVAENWDTPFIITTFVQFFETLFSRRTYKLRKLHNIANSIIIIDEVQTLPRVLYEATVEALSLLAEDYGCTIVLMTATQPALGQNTTFPSGFPKLNHIVSPELAERMASATKRVEYHYLPKKHFTTWTQLIQELEAQERVLCVVNTTRQAHILASMLQKRGSHFLHLSTRMCPHHRMSVLAEATERLKAGMECRLISTQCIEAGVDISFPVVYRSMGPLDSIIQVAGRCNRNGELEREGKMGHVYIFDPPDHTNYPPCSDYQKASELARDEIEILLEDGKDLDLDSPTAYHDYSMSAYSLMPESARRDKIRFAISEQKHDLLDETYWLIQKGGIVTIYADFPSGKKSINDIVTDAKIKGRLNRDDYQQIERYAINVFEEQFSKQNVRIIEEVINEDQSLTILTKDHYDPNLGFITDKIKEEIRLLCESM